MPSSLEIDMSEVKKDAMAIVEPIKASIEEKVSRAIIEMQHVEMQLQPKTFDMLRYRSGDNGLMLFIYGDHDCNDEDKVIARLKQVIAKYESKKKNKTYKGKMSKGGLPLPQKSILTKLLGG